MSTKLYVGNINYNISADELRVLFSEVGTVEAVRIISDRVTGRSRGFAFVEMSNPQEAEKAINQFNGSTLSERKLLIYLAHDNKALSQSIREAKQNHLKAMAASNPFNQVQNTYTTPANTGRLTARVEMAKRAS